MTVQGAGGTGKSFIINMIRTIMMSMFPNLGTFIVSAPVGVAAYNIKGFTCHKAFSVNVNDPASPLPFSKENALKKLLQNVLLLIIDERSMLSMDVLGAIETNCRKCAFNGHNSSKDFGGIPIILLFGDDHQLPPVQKFGKGYGTDMIFTDTMQMDTRLNPIQRLGRHCFLLLSKNVVTLTKVRRVDDDAKELLDICENIRNNGGVTDEQSILLKKLHLCSGYVSSKRIDFLKQNAMWVYPTNEQVDNHNFESLKKLVSSNNPVIQIGSKMTVLESSSRSVPARSHFDKDLLKKVNVSLCRGCKVSIDRNICETIGLFNGATGTVKEIRFKTDESPLKGDLPEYILMDLDTYTGKQWHPKSPSLVPIYACNVICNYHCCKLTYFPMSLAFARTIHKVQGKEFGPRFKGQPALVADIGLRQLEGKFPGITYTVISRVSSTGNGNVDESALYFCGDTLEEDRFTDLLHKKTNKSNTGKQLYDKIEKRLRWILYIQRRSNETHIEITSEQKQQIRLWIESTIYHLDELQNIISNYCYNSSPSLE